MGRSATQTGRLLGPVRVLPPGGSSRAALVSGHQKGGGGCDPSLCAAVGRACLRVSLSKPALGSISPKFSFPGSKNSRPIEKKATTLLRLSVTPSGVLGKVVGCYGKPHLRGPSYVLDAARRATGGKEKTSPRGETLAPARRIVFVPPGGISTAQKRLAGRKREARRASETGRCGYRRRRENT